MSVHCLYPDFFRFLDTLDEEGKQELGRWERFERLYFDKHSEILSTLWFQCQTYSRENIRERVLAVKRGDYGELRSALLRYDLPGATEAVLERCAGIARHVPADVYLLVGFFSPDAFVADFGGKPSICVGLERFRTFRHYPILLSHEYCHLLVALRKSRSAEDVVQRAVGEGLAVYFSRLAFPGEREHTCLFMKERSFWDLLSQYPGAREAAEELRKCRESGGDLFHGHWEPNPSAEADPSGDGNPSGEPNPSWDGNPHGGPASAGTESRRVLPPRAGYFFGYMLVREYVEKTGIRTIEELIGRRGDISVDFGLR
jgi:hypothetical protein